MQVGIFWWVGVLEVFLFILSLNLHLLHCVTQLKCLKFVIDVSGT